MHASANAKMLHCAVTKFIYSSLYVCLYCPSNEERVQLVNVSNNGTPNYAPNLILSFPSSTCFTSLLARQSVISWFDILRK
jgi:hypothetical protein